MEVSIIPRLFSKNTAENSLKSANVLFKPKTLLRKLTVAKPVQQEIKLMAYSPETFFKDRIASVFSEMNKTYGNIPLWVKYSMYPASVSWNLGNIQATHGIRVYGEDQYAKEFLTRLDEIINNDGLSTSNGVNILSQSPSNWIAGLSNVNVNDKRLPATLHKSANKTTLRSDLLSASGLVAGLAGVILALSFFSNRRSTNRKRRVSRQEALKTALNNVSELTSSTPVLEDEEFTGDSWHFKISDFKVTVNNMGAITEVKKVLQK